MSELRVFDGVAGDTPAAWAGKGSDWQRQSFSYASGVPSNRPPNNS